MSVPILHRAVDDGGDVGDATAADADGQACTWTKPRREAAVVELVPCLSRDVAKAAVRKILADEKEARRKHQGECQGQIVTVDSR